MHALVKRNELYYALTEVFQTSQSVRAPIKLKNSRHPSKVHACVV